MTPDREQAIERICLAALERDGAVRDAFLADACGTDMALRREVEALLAHEDTAAGFLDRPALAVVTRDERSWPRAQRGSAARQLHDSVAPRRGRHG